MTSKIQIHDSMTVELIDFMGNDDRVVQAARVSTKGANEVYKADGVPGLINYLMREKHGSPFEHTALTFYVKAPIFVFREFQRHRIASYNEMSGRYTKLLPEFYIPNADRKLVNVGTSAKPEMAIGTKQQYEYVEDGALTVYEEAWHQYERMINAGVANEVARIVLPVGIYSQMYVTMNLRAMFNFLTLRIHDQYAAHISRPQREIEMVGELLQQDVKRLFPTSFSSFERNKRVAP